MKFMVFGFEIIAGSPHLYNEKSPAVTITPVDVRQIIVFFIKLLITEVYHKISKTQFKARACYMFYMSWLIVFFIEV